jgi:hypothetical protein
MSELTVLIDGPMAVEGVTVRWVEDLTTISPAARGHIEERWAGYLADAQAHGKTLFNGAISRLIDAKGDSKGVTLTLGPADYKAFIVTAMRDRAWFVQNAPEAIAPALGNSVLLTGGARALLGIRSRETSAYAGRAHLLGGVLDRLGNADFPASVEGLLAHLRLELSEEASLSAGDMVGSPTLLAIGHDSFLGQPEAIWQWESAVELEEIAARLNVREHHDSVILEKGGVPTATREQMTPVARAAWEKWRALAP